MQDNLSRRAFLKVVGLSPLLSLIPSFFTSFNPSHVSAGSSVAHSALDLYGGKDAVVKRMDTAVREELIKWDIEGRMPEIQSYFRNHPEIIKRVYAVMDGREKVNYEFFDRVAWGKLDMNINEILGKPNFKDRATKDYWASKSGGWGPETWASIRAIEELYDLC